MKYSESIENGVLVFELSGFLKGRPEGYELLETIRGKIADGTDKMVIDLGGIDRMDSSGIGVIASIITSAESGGCSLCFCNVEGRIHELLEMVGITKVIECGQCRDEAIGKLRE